jgi:16S rRNA (cytosine967-C5)-methyltransferase
MTRPNRAVQSEVPGLAARRIAADIIEAVLRQRRPLDEQLDGAHAHPQLSGLSDRDRALVRMLVGTVLRRLGSLQYLLGIYVAQGLPANSTRLQTALLLGAAQILWLDVPDHAAVDLSVRLVQADRQAGRYAGLVNAVLRRVATQGAEDLAGLDRPLDLPEWLLRRWESHYGETAAAQIARAMAHPPPLDLSFKPGEHKDWHARLHGRVLPTGTLRAQAHGPVFRLPGYDEGVWWVQDAAAALPARLLGDVTEKTVADLCAAPGGKTAQLAAAGAKVTAVDRSPARLRRLADNLMRLRLTAELVEADAAEWEGGPFDAVLLDAPCLSTGTIRRHPDIAWLKQEDDIAGLAALQARLLAHAVELTRPGGMLVYCTCSLEPEEGEHQVAALLDQDPPIRRVPVEPAEVAGLSELINADGDLRTLPLHLPADDPAMAGMDGFFAARLQRI